MIDPGETDDLFDRLEFLITLEFAHFGLQAQAASKDGLWFWIPIGRYIWKSGGDGIFARLTAHDDLPPDHSVLRAGLLGGTPTAATEAVLAVWNLVQQHPCL